jgi:hypothetical protein
MLPLSESRSRQTFHLGIESYSALCIAERCTELDLASPELVAVAETVVEAALELALDEAEVMKAIARQWDVTSVLRGGASDEYAKVYFTAARLLRACWRLRHPGKDPSRN